MEAPETATKRTQRKDTGRQPGHRPANVGGGNDIHFDDRDLEDTSFWHDAPLFAAILPCVGAVFLWDGADWITDTILFLCVTWYLHMLIKVPWDLYTLSRPRPRPKHLLGGLSAEQKVAEAALQWRSILYLIVALLTPFFGLHLLRTILTTVGAVSSSSSYITYFHSTLFVLIAGIRPFKHLVALLMGHTRTLQGVVHHPSQDNSSNRAEELEAKLDQLEIIISDLATRLRHAEQKNVEEHAKREQGIITVQDSFDRTAARLEEGARRRERKVEVSIEVLERKVEGMEKKLDSVSRMTLSTAKEEFFNGNGYQGYSRNGRQGSVHEGAVLSRILLRVWDRLEWMWVLMTGGGLGYVQGNHQKPPPPYGQLSPGSGYTFPPKNEFNKKGHHPHHSQALSFGAVRSGLPLMRRVGGSLSNGAGTPSLQTVLEEEGEPLMGKEVESPSQITNRNGFTTLQDDMDEEPLIHNNVERRATYPIDAKSSAFNTTHISAKHQRAGSSQKGSTLKVRFELTKEKHGEDGLIHRAIRFVFAPLRLVRQVFISLLGRIISLK